MPVSGRWIESKNASPLSAQPFLFSISFKQLYCTSSFQETLQETPQYCFVAMPSARPLEDIQEGVYLDDVKSDFSRDVSPNSRKNFSRPYAVPVHDPQRSNQDLRRFPHQPYLSPERMTKQDPTICSKLSTNFQGWYGGDQLRAGTRLGVNLQRPKSIISLTPSVLPIGSQPLSYGQHQELRRVTRHEKERRPSPIIDKEEEFLDEPPNGGFLAWAHAVAGCIVCFNAQ